MTDVMWIQPSETKRDVDLSWLVKDGMSIRAMFEPPTPPAPKPAPPAAPQAPPQQPLPPPGPTPEQLKTIAECEQVLRVAGAAIAELQEATRLETASAAALITEMGLSVAEELAAGAINVDENRVVTLIVQALELLDTEREVKVHLNPVLYEKLMTSGELEAVRKAHHLTIRPENRVADAGCIVESQTGQVDARIKSRLRQLRHLVAEKQGTRDHE